MVISKTTDKSFKLAPHAVQMASRNYLALSGSPYLAPRFFRNRKPPTTRCNLSVCRDNPLAALAQRGAKSRPCTQRLPHTARKNHDEDRQAQQTMKHDRAIRRHGIRSGIAVRLDQRADRPNETSKRNDAAQDPDNQCRADRTESRCTGKAARVTDD
ncbi:hypothetical protein BCEN4_1320032 [Burkholderia cenocepacia]|nr:hypothetical protein BCEN4_1320032 [Burkholderia cenocepacia]